MQTAIARFKQYIENRYPDRNTAKHYMSDLNIFSQFVKVQSPRDIDTRQIDAFVQAQSARGMKAATINRRLSAISSFYQFLISETEDDSLHNPVIWKRHSIRLGRHLPRDANDETISQLLAVVDHARDRAMLELMLGAGLRVSEVVALQLNDLHPVDETGLARLRVRGKGDKERVTWLTRETCSYIQCWLQERPQSDNTCLFLSQRRHPISVDGVQYRLKQYCQQAGVQITCHQLRHTYARRLVEHGMPIDSLAKLLGHNDLQTTQRYIDGADPALRRDFHQAMQALDQHSLPQPQSKLDRGASIAFTPHQPDERPDSVALVDHLSHLASDLPDWLHQALRTHTIHRIARWPPHRAKTQTGFHFSLLCRITRWLVTQRHWQQLDQLQRTDLVAYVNARLEASIKPQTIAAELAVFRAFWRDLLAQEMVTNGAILQVKAPPAGDRLPRYLTLTEFQRLEQVIRTQTQTDTCQDRFNRAWFYLLAHAGLRMCEVLNLRLSDCDLNGRRLRVTSGKGNRDRVIPMTDQLVAVVRDYLAVREPTTTDHLLIYQHVPVKDGLIPHRLRRFGKLAQIEPLSPHRLRHTLATALINQGMPITSLQKFLGHQDINNTLIYARVHDETVRNQFSAAIAQIQAIAVQDWPLLIPELVQPFSTAQT